MNEKCYQIKNCKFSGQYKNVYKSAWQEYLKIKKRSKRTTYIRAAYFQRDKIFLNIFWTHLKQKYRFERRKRLIFYRCAIEVIRKTRIAPESRQNPNNDDEILHRFMGKVDETYFAVQIKENKRNNRKDFISVFPWKK